MHAMMNIRSCTQDWYSCVNWI